MITKEEKLAIVKKLGKSEKDTGNVSVQIGILTHEIENLTKHFAINKKDLHSSRGFVAKIEKRKKLLSYLKNNDFSAYTNLLTTLNLRK